ncbi:hypothetical protein Q3G72_030173 [Acer saccharum]|nr:hypothetical protein Q3G72_030173 [Acer saccharum]
MGTSRKGCQAELEWWHCQSRVVWGVSLLGRCCSVFQLVVWLLLWFQLSCVLAVFAVALWPFSLFLFPVAAKISGTFGQLGL